jgi:hypothetical protein
MVSFSSITAATFILCASALNVPNPGYLALPVHAGPGLVGKIDPQMAESVDTVSNRLNGYKYLVNSKPQYSLAKYVIQDADAL